MQVRSAGRSSKGGEGSRKVASPPGVPAQAAPPVEELLRKLVARAGDLPPAVKEPVLFDGQIDGVRCLLVRSPPPPVAAPRAAAAPATIGAPVASPRPTLSPREQEIVRMVAQGYPNKIIADVLEISVWTVGTHLRRIFAKVAVTSRAAMVARILNDGLMRERDP